MLRGGGDDYRRESAADQKASRSEPERALHFFDGAALRFAMGDKPYASIPPLACVALAISSTGPGNRLFDLCQCRAPRMHRIDAMTQLRRPGAGAEAKGGRR